MNVLNQIAREAGVSTATVTRALNRVGPYVRPKCGKRAEQIRELAERYGYRVNAAAKAMSTGRFHTVGCLHSTNLHATSSYQADLIASVHTNLEANDYYVTSSYLSDDRLTNASTFPKFVRELAVDGLLIDYVARVPDLARKLIDHCQLPAIWMNVKHDTHCVYPDDIAAGRMATEHLIEVGHRKIAYGELAITSHYSHTDRMKGYHQAMKCAGLEPQVIKPKVDAMGDRVDMARKILGQIDKPTAFVTPSPGSSNPFAAATLAHGLEIGRDIAFVTINSQFERAFGVEMSTVLIPFRKVGEVCVNELIAKIEDPARQCPSIAVPPTFERGKTS